MAFFHFHLPIQCAPLQASVGGWLYTCNVVSKPHCGQGDNDEVGWFQQGPLLHLLKNEDWQRNKEHATQQDGQDSWDHTHDGGTNSPFLSEKDNQLVPWIYSLYIKDGRGDVMSLICLWSHILSLEFSLFAISSLAFWNQTSWTRFGSDWETSLPSYADSESSPILSHFWHWSDPKYTK